MCAWLICLYIFRAKKQAPSISQLMLGACFFAKVALHSVAKYDEILKKKPKEWHHSGNFYLLYIVYGFTQSKAHTPLYVAAHFSTWL